MKKEFYFLLVSSLLLGSCENKEDNKLLGQIIGSVTGAYLGSKIGSGIGKDISMVLGTAVGLVLGGKIAEVLDDDEKEDFGKKIQDSLESNPDNTSSKWTSKKNKNLNAEILPTNSYEIDNQTCRDFKKIVEKNGEKIEEESTACRDEQGNWKVI
tara:strand:+ start:9 stop:473 length:465 start_codon:yes stop_codon:yes gene_type:complete